MDPALRLQADQQELTPAQIAEAERFVEEYIRRQLSTEPVDEREAEAFLRQAYQVAGLAPPQRIQWLDGPLQLVAALAPPSVEERLKDRVGASIEFSVRASVKDSLWASVRESVRESVKESVENGIVDRVEASVWELVGASIEFSVRASVGDGVEDRVDWELVGDRLEDGVRNSVWA